jgi:hypothetical protein
MHGSMAPRDPRGALLKQVFNMRQPSLAVLGIVLAMSKATRKNDEHAAQLARMRRICSELDDVREKAECLRREITGEARRLYDAALTPELSRTLQSRTREPAAERRDARVPRDGAN